MDNLGFGVCEKLRRAAIHLMLPFVVLFAISASAGEKPSGSYRPLGADEVPSPIPRDFPCIEVWWQVGSSPHEKGRRVGFYDPPHSADTRHLMEKARRAGRAILKACKVQGT